MVITRRQRTKIIGVNATSNASHQLYLAGTGNTFSICQPRFETDTDIDSNGIFNGFYWYSKDGNGGVGQWSVDLFWRNSGNYATNWNNYSKLNGFDTFVLGNKRYFVVSYANEGMFADNASGQSIIIKDEAGNTVATWNNPRYISSMGYMTITTQKVSDNTVYIYVYNCTGNFNNSGHGAIAGAMLRFSNDDSDAPSFRAPKTPGTASIEDFEISNEDFDAEPVYFNLQGVEVKNPESGIYIVRRGGTVTKEVIR